MPEYSPRPADVPVYVVRNKDITGPLMAYALGLAKDGRAYMICEQGVGYEVREDKPWRWSDFWPDCPTFNLEEIKAEADMEHPVPLSLWVSTFGDRLENNFWIWHHRLTQPA